jgi:2-oxoisovalerate dehydrogenase E1 component alpha subunit
MPKSNSDKGKHQGFFIPEPSARPGDTPDFSRLPISPVGSVARPQTNATPETLRDLPFKLIRTLNEDGIPEGEWQPEITIAVVRKIYEYMRLTRIFDTKMFRVQRQGKTSFFLASRGEEALGVVPSIALRTNDMCFPTYRQVGWLLARGYPLVKLINQIFNNSDDPLKGKQLPVLYSARDFGFYSLSGNVGTRFGHAVGWSMAKAYRNSDDIAIGFIGDGTTAEGSFHEALTFASVYKAPVILGITNNQWAISTFTGLATNKDTTFASKALSYGIPGLRVDGNDALAVYSVLDWAADRARHGHGATLIEFFTYRSGAHSTSDDPERYRPKEEALLWPLGDPIERLRQHLLTSKAWSEEKDDQLHTMLDKQVTESLKEAERIGVLGESKPDVREMFEGVFKEQDWRAEEQLKELGL